MNIPANFIPNGSVVSDKKRIEKKKCTSLSQKMCVTVKKRNKQTKGLWFMVFNPTFNNISAISWQWIIFNTNH